MNLEEIERSGKLEMVAREDRRFEKVEACSRIFAKVPESSRRNFRETIFETEVVEINQMKQLLSGNHYHHVLEGSGIR